MKISIGDYLIKRLKEVGIEHIIGVPGDFNMNFLEQVRKADGIKFVGASNELNAAYAADGYARQIGISAYCVTYGVGDLAGLGGIAGASAEHLPIIALTGAPPLYAQRNRYKMHHTLAEGNYSNINNAYDEISQASETLTHENAPEVIDRLISLAIRYKEPVNIQIPSNLSYFEIEVDDKPLFEESQGSDQESLQAAVGAIFEKFEKAKRPLVLVDMDVDRYDLAEDFLQFVESSQVPFVQLNTGKAILDENHELFYGTYKGDGSTGQAQDLIENADFILTVNPRMTEWSSDFYSGGLSSDALVNLHSDYVFVGHETFEAVQIHEVMDALLEKVEEAGLKKEVPAKEEAEEKDSSGNSDGDHASDQGGQDLRHENFWPIIEGFLEEGDTIFAETGSSSQALGGIRLPKDTKYVNSSTWGAIGYTLPGLWGSLLADPDKRQLLFIGDGSFQVTAQALSRIIYHDLNPIIFVINNDGYTIERYIMGMDADYNDIPQWEYHKLPDLMDANNKMISFDVKTESELKEALEEAKTADHGVLIEVNLPAKDAPQALKELGPSIATFNYGQRGPENEGLDEVL